MHRTTKTCVSTRSLAHPGSVVGLPARPICARRTLAAAHATGTRTVEAPPVSRRPRRQSPAAPTGAVAGCAPSSGEPGRWPEAGKTPALSRPHVCAGRTCSRSDSNCSSLIGMPSGSTTTTLGLPSPAARPPAPTFQHFADTTLHGSSTFRFRSAQVLAPVGISLTDEQEIRDPLRASDRVDRVLGQPAPGCCRLCALVWRQGRRDQAAWSRLASPGAVRGSVLCSFPPNRSCLRRRRSFRAPHWSLAPS